MESRHQLKPEDYPRREAFSRWFTTRQPKFVRDIIKGDEATFPMNGNVNTNNVRHCAPRDQPPLDFTYDIPTSREKLAVWAGMIGDGTLIGPIFIDGNVNAHKYLDLINDDFVPEILSHGRYNLNQNQNLQNQVVSGRGLKSYSSCCPSSTQ